MRPSTLDKRSLYGSTPRPSSIDSQRLDALRVALLPLLEELLGHPIYAAVSTLPRLRRFMSHHVFAVWDFMCLAKRLQRDLTSLDTLWRPPTRPSLARFINGIIYGEESDIDPEGCAASHFDLYLAAMEELGASTVPARGFVSMLREGAAVEACFTAAGVAVPARKFVAHTLHAVEHGTTIEVLSSFLFGREDLIPEMFSRFLGRWAESRRARRFAYYIERHIELDGGDHGPAGRRALVELAGHDDAAWEKARYAAQSALSARISLWNRVHAELLDL